MFTTSYSLFAESDWPKIKQELKKSLDTYQWLRLNKETVRAKPFNRARIIKMPLYQDGYMDTSCLDLFTIISTELPQSMLDKSL